MKANLPLVKNSTQKGVINANTVHVYSVKKQVSFGDASEIKIVGKNTEAIFNWLGKQKTPFNRAVIGLVAILTQPWIDLFNKDVDEETRKTSCVRTAAKFAIGTGTGIGVRKIFIDYVVPQFTKTKEELGNKVKKSHHDWLKPSESIIVAKDFERMKRTLSKHREVCGTFIAIAVMMLTDPPLTLWTTNFLNKHFNTQNKNKITDKTKGDKEHG